MGWGMLLQFTREVSPVMIPIVGTISGTAMVVLIVGIVVFNKSRIQEMEHTLQLRRMEHERRMKELELELARLRGTAPAGRS